MKLTIQGQGDVTLTRRDFLASGGEGSVYVQGQTAFKVYADPRKMIPAGKIAELAAVTVPQVIRPQRVLTDRKGAAVGYTMRFVAGALPLCQILTRAFRERNGLDHATMLKLVHALQALVGGVHRAGVLIVDLNELNILVDTAFTEVYAIDTDSYQTASYPATALMPSVRDWHTPPGGFHEGSDWFSFAVLAFRMFTGIHPYKGKHPTVQGLEARMRANVSVFDPAVAVPNVVYPVDVIPPAWRDWLRCVLQDGQRVPPPSTVAPFVAVAPVRTVVSGDTLDITELFRDPDEPGGVRVYAERGGTSVVICATGVFVDGRRVRARVLGRDAAIGFSPRLARPVLASIQGDALQLIGADGAPIRGLAARADALVGHDGTLYVHSGDRVLEVVLTEVGTDIVASARVAANVLPHATRLFDGCAIQSLLGSTFVSVFPRAGATFQLRVPELDGATVVAARHHRGVLMVVIARHGRYDRLTLRFDEAWRSYGISAVEDITPAVPDFLALDNGVVVHLTEAEQLEVWSSRGSTGGDRVRVVASDALGGDMRLVEHGGRVAFIRGRGVYGMRMR